MPTRRGLVIQTDGFTEIREITDYTDIREAVGGDFDWAAPGPVQYYCYEYALFERPVNPVATALYHETHPGINEPLNGPVLVMGPVKDEDDTDVPDEIVNRAADLCAELQPHMAELAVPLTAKQQMDIQTKMIVAQNQATRALKEGRGVDFGGAIIDPQGWPFSGGSAPYDGNRRQQGRRS